MKKNSPILLALVFFAGCVTASVVKLETPSAHARSSQKWEHHCESFVFSLSEKLTNLGEMGWELVTQDDNRYCFKRPAQ
ncbi:MAG: hypothetical protein GY822_00840 [Deltaproteobacteria bacterium]|nr:hypothetical protein [Deltaproteobacteria bacterium]